MKCNMSKKLLSMLISVILPSCLPNVNTGTVRAVLQKKNSPIFPSPNVDSAVMLHCWQIPSGFGETGGDQKGEKENETKTGMPDGSTVFVMQVIILFCNGSPDRNRSWRDSHSENRSDRNRAGRSHLSDHGRTGVRRADRQQCGKENDKNR